MKKWMASLVLLLGLLLPMGAMADDVAINEINFLDVNFREKVVRGFDQNGDGKLSDSEINDVTSISCGGNDIQSLKGIEFFTALETLDCNYNNLTELDISKNTALTTLDCNSNYLTELDISKNTALEGVDCYFNRLTKLNIGKNTTLKDLNCSHNQLTELDIGKSTALEKLYCNENKLTELDIRENTALETLNCTKNQLTKLYIGRNTALEGLHCENNQLTELDVGACTALKNLYCGENQLTKLSIEKNAALEALLCDYNQLTELDTSVLTALKTLCCKHNQLTELNIKANTKLEKMECENNRLTELDVRENTALVSLMCSNNALTELDLGANTRLEELNCFGNQLACINTNSKFLGNFNASGNTHTIFPDADGMFDLSTLKGFDVNKASGWNGGSVSGSTLRISQGAKQVSYTYDCGRGKSDTFTLNAMTASLVVDDLKTLYMTNDLKANGIRNVQQIKDRMQEAIRREYKDFAEANRVYDDVSYGAMAGGTWQNAPLPQGGLEILLPFPEGSDPKTHDYLVTHMIAQGVNAGLVEKPDFKVEDQGIRVRLTSLSPVCIAWKVNQATQNTAQDLPKTGDNANLTLWLVLLGGCGAALALVMRKRKA